MPTLLTVYIATFEVLLKDVDVAPYFAEELYIKAPINVITYKAEIIRKDVLSARN
jgi:hypothetical protein